MKEPGTVFEYSDAGYCIVQMIVENVTGREYDSDGNLLLELCGEENVIRPFLDILDKEFQKQLLCEMVELEGKPDYGIGDFRIG